MTPRILIVDDDSSIRTLLSVVATRAGVESDVASDGLEAIEKMKAAIEKAIASRLSGGIMCMSDRPTKITFGDMRDMGVRGILVSGR